MRRGSYDRAASRARRRSRQGEELTTAGRRGDTRSVSKTDQQWNPRKVDYEPFDSARHKKLADELEARIAHLTAFHRLDKGSNIEARHFTAFSYLLQQGRSTITYVSYAVDAPDGGQYMFWLTDRHAEAIGKALIPTLRNLQIDLTRLEHDGF